MIYTGRWQPRLLARVAITVTAGLGLIAVTAACSGQGPAKPPTKSTTLRGGSAQQGTVADAPEAYSVSRTIVVSPKTVLTISARWASSDGGTTLYDFRARWMAAEMRCTPTMDVFLAPAGAGQDRAFDRWRFSETGQGFNDGDTGNVATFNSATSDSGKPHSSMTVDVRDPYLGFDLHADGCDQTKEDAFVGGLGMVLTANGK
jgi:hypothetical protein